MTNIDLQATLERMKELNAKTIPDGSMGAQTLGHNLFMWRQSIDDLYAAFEASMALNKQLVGALNEIAYASHTITEADCAEVAKQALTAAKAHNIKG